VKHALHRGQRACPCGHGLPGRAARLRDRGFTVLLFWMTTMIDAADSTGAPLSLPTAGTRCTREQRLHRENHNQAQDRRHEPATASCRGHAPDSASIGRATPHDRAPAALVASVHPAPGDRCPRGRSRPSATRNTHDGKDARGRGRTSRRSQTGTELRQDLRQAGNPTRQHPT